MPPRAPFRLGLGRATHLEPAFPAVALVRMRLVRWNGCKVCDAARKSCRNDGMSSG